MPVHSGDDLGHVLVVDLLLEEAGVAVGALLGLRELALELGDLAVAQLGGALQVGLALGALGVAVRLLEALLELLHAHDRVLLLLPAGLHLGRLLAQVGEVALDRLASGDRGVVLLLLERLALDLELHDAALDLVDLGRHRVDLDAQPRSGLVDQVDRLVGQEAVGDVAVRERRRGDDRRVLDAHAVVDLVALLQSAQDRDRVLHARLVHEDGLEAALQRRVLLDVLAVLVERGRADRAQLATGEHRLEEVGGVDRSLRGAGADDRVQLVEEDDDAALAVGDLLEDGLEPVLELAAVLGAGDQRADVERDHAPVAQRVGDVAGDDPLCQPLDDRGLADARLADQDGVVLGAAREHLDHAPDLVVAPDDRVELPLLGGLGQVAPVGLERLVLVLGVLVGHPMRPAHLLDGRRQLIARGADVGLRIGSQSEQQVLGRDVLVAHAARLVVGALEQFDQGGAERRGGAGRAGYRGELVGGLVGAAPDALRIGAGALQDRNDDAGLLLEQGEQEMRRGHLRVVTGAGKPLRRGKRLLGLDCESISLHRLSK